VPLVPLLGPGIPQSPSPLGSAPEGAGAFRLLNTRAMRSGLQARTGSPGWDRLLPNCSASLSLQGIESPSARFSGRYRIAPVARLGLPERQNIPSPLQRAKEDNLSPNRKLRNRLGRPGFQPRQFPPTKNEEINQRGKAARRVPAPTCHFQRPSTRSKGAMVPFHSRGEPTRMAQPCDTDPTRVTKPRRAVRILLKTTATPEAGIPATPHEKNRKTTTSARARLRPHPLYANIRKANLHRGDPGRIISDCMNSSKYRNGPIQTLSSGSITAWRRVSIADFPIGR
jgi:hypothetical protein